MITETPTPPETDPDGVAPSAGVGSTLIGRITRSEVVAAVTVAATMLVLVLIEPNILAAPFENERTLLFTFGATALAGIAFVAMLWFRVPAAIRVIVLVVPFVIVNWWLISPYFIDDVVDEGFVTSISEQVVVVADPPAATSLPEVPVADLPAASTDRPGASGPAEQASEPGGPAEQEPPPERASTGPVLLGAGQFVGLAGHSGTGDAGIFRNPDGSLILRFENFDIENGPDLEVYLVPGADQTSLADGSIHLGALKGNIGDQNYELPADTELPPGEYTALVWCEAFSVEFVGATIVV